MRRINRSVSSLSPSAHDRMTTDRRQLVLARDREPWMTRIDNHLPPIQAQRSKAFDKKSRSTTTDQSWPEASSSRRPDFLVLGAPLGEYLGELLDRLALPGRNLRRMLRPWR